MENVEPPEKSTSANPHAKIAETSVPPDVPLPVTKSDLVALERTVNTNSENIANLTQPVDELTQQVAELTQRVTEITTRVNEPTEVVAKVGPAMVTKDDFTNFTIETNKNIHALDQKIKDNFHSLDKKITELAASSVTKDEFTELRKRFDGLENKLHELATRKELNELANVVHGLATKQELNELANVVHELATKQELNELANVVHELAKVVAKQGETLSKKIDKNHETLSKKIDGNIETLSKKIDGNIETLSKKIDGNIESLSKKIDGQNLVLNRHIRSTLYWVVGTSVAFMTATFTAISATGILG